MGASHSKVEFPPLLAPGFHGMTFEELHDLCITPFLYRGDHARMKVMDGIKSLVGKLSDAGVVGDVWIDGSFLTQKIDPDDADIIVHVSAEQYENDPSAKAAVDWSVHDDRQSSHFCDGYKWVEYQRGHIMFNFSDINREKWTKWFGRSRPPKREPKGIAVIAIPTCAK